MGPTTIAEQEALLKADVAAAIDHTDACELQLRETERDLESVRKEFEQCLSAGNLRRGALVYAQLLPLRQLQHVRWDAYIHAGLDITKTMEALYFFQRAAAAVRTAKL